MEIEKRLIASFQKNSAEAIKVFLQTWNRGRYLDIRVWTQARPGDGEDAAQPTKKGLCLNVELLDDLKAAIDAAIVVVCPVDSPAANEGEPASGSTDTKDGIPF